MSIGFAAIRRSLFIPKRLPDIAAMPDDFSVALW
jgi:hypothetical protein